MMRGMPAIWATSGANAEAWLDILGQTARLYRLPPSEQRARVAALWGSAAMEDERIRAIARATGLAVRFTAPVAAWLTSWRVPVICCLTDGELALVTAIDASGDATFSVAGERGLQSRRPVRAMIDQSVFVVVPRPIRSVADTRLSSATRPFKKRWPRRILPNATRADAHFALASILTRLLRRFRIRIADMPGKRAELRPKVA